jgi:hypothetical protein
MCSLHQATISNISVQARFYGTMLFFQTFMAPCFSSNIYVYISLIGKRNCFTYDTAPSETCTTYDRMASDNTGERVNGGAARSYKHRT